MSELQDPNTYFDLAGKVAVVTGGSRGLGLHAATVFLRAGAKTVFVTARKAEGVSAAVDQLNKLPGIKGKAIGIAADVANTKEIQRLVDDIQTHESQVDILVANAGASWGGPFEPTPDRATEKVLDLNVKGVFNLARLFTPVLVKAGTPTSPSRIIVVSSTAGSTVSHVGEHGTIMYSVSKAAAQHLTRNLAVELGPRNITVNSISPGFFPSKLANGLIDILGGEEELKQQNPRRRLGVPDDIAATMLFLASPGANYINGVDIPCDGGRRLVHVKL
ncbi:NAD(P)-binding protein [Aspergillus taichungensis]|uniref:NAD(P)-binding protein n=1 Tax=Aspergillus taichungensis TaxID=482145 RepID=A0A2J5HIE2_9EURO|nr:NAD(P)-binding protein [Aspergillus taichungensis]